MLSSYPNVQYRVRRGIVAQFEDLIFTLQRPRLLVRIQYHVDDCFLGLVNNKFEYIEQRFEEDLGTFIWLSDCISEKKD